jgi:flagellar M-ring protein FliF
MNFLNNAIAQLSDLFRSMTPGARITAGLLLAVVVVSFGYLFRQSTAGPDAYLFGGEALSDGDLNRIEMAIAQGNLSGHVREGNRIRVPAGQQAAYLAAIADAGAQPSNFNTILSNALDKTTAWESRDAAKERIKDARQRQLSEIVRAMNWVEEAVVIYDEQEARGLSKEKKVTASVSVQPKVGQSLDPQRREMLRKFVASAVMGLKAESVIVTNLGDGSMSGGAGGVDPSLFDDPYYQKRVAYEQYKRETILRLLVDIPGVLVEVNAELDDTAAETTNSSKRDSKNQATLRETQTEEKTTQSNADRGGQPGPASQGPNPQGVAAAPQRQNQNEANNSAFTYEYLPGVESQTIMRQGFTPKEVLATVMIPTKYFESVWTKQNPDAAEAPKAADLKGIESEVITKVQDMVEQLLMQTADQARDTRKRVKVVALDTLPAPAIVPPSMASKALAWSGRYWNTVAMLGVAMFSLMVLRSVVKNAPAPSATPQTAAAAPALTLTSEEPAGRGDTPAGEEPADDRPRLRLKKGTTVKDDLVEIVREDPDAAADILRSWIGKAG